MREMYFVKGKNGHNKPLEVYQPNVRAARVTRDRLAAESITDLEIERWKESDDGWNVSVVD